MIAEKDLYMIDLPNTTIDLYRMGNATWPNFAEKRARKDLIIERHNDVEFIVANKNGFSAWDHVTRRMKEPGEKIWRIKKGAALPPEVRVVQDLTTPGHYMLAPIRTMPLMMFLSALLDLGMDPSRVERVLLSRGR